MSRPIPRRHILAAAAGLSAAPFVRAFAPQEPRDKIKLAVVGLANRGEANWTPWLARSIAITTGRKSAAMPLKKP